MRTQAGRQPVVPDRGQGFFAPVGGPGLFAPVGMPTPNVDLADLTARVAAATGKRFFISSEIPTRIYINGPPLEHPTYAVFLLALDANDLAAVEMGGGVLIVPEHQARALPTKIVQNDDASIPDDEWVTRVITVSGNTASRLVPVLRPLMPQSAFLSAAGGGPSRTESKLVITDRYGNVKRVTALVKALTQ